MNSLAEIGRRGLCLSPDLGKTWYVGDPNGWRTSWGKTPYQAINNWIAKYE